MSLNVTRDNNCPRETTLIQTLTMDPYTYVGRDNSDEHKDWSSSGGGGLAIRGEIHPHGSRKPVLGDSFDPYKGREREPMFVGK